MSNRLRTAAGPATVTGLVTGFLLLATSAPALAQAPLPEAKEDVRGGDVSGKYKPGIFAQADAGTFFTVGGANGNSNAQLYAGMEFGYALDISGTGLLSISLSYAIGSSDNNAVKGKCAAQADDCPATENFSLNFTNLNVKYSHLVFEQRLAVFGRLGGGTTFATPKTTFGEGSVLFNGQFGTGIDYYTRIPNLAVGVELGGFYVAPTSIIGVSIFPLVKYTF